MRIKIIIEVRRAGRARLVCLWIEIVSGYFLRRKSLMICIHLGIYYACVDLGDRY